MNSALWIIDDCPLSTRLTRARLLRLGVACRIFPSGNAAVAAWMEGTAKPPLAMLMDLEMPGRSGLDTGHVLRDAGYLGLLMLHTAQPPKDPDTLSEHGFDGLILKPASAEALLGMIVRAQAEAARRSA